MVSLIVAVALNPLSAEPKFMPCVQAWTFNRFTVYEAVEMVSRAGGKYIELFPGQTLRKGSDTKIGPELAETESQALLDHLKSHGVKAVAFGVTGVSKDPAQARPLFQWARRMGIGVINTESAEAIDTIELMVKEFDIKVGFHDHPRRPNDPSYRMWDPNYVYSLVKDRDKRIGACADTGHWVRSGIKPVDAIRTLKGRIVSSHLKDLHVFSPDGHDVVFGTGVSDVPGILDAFQKMPMTGPVSVEYEHNWDASLVDVGNCLGFIRGYFRR